jgi:hypothetical protein
MKKEYGTLIGFLGCVVLILGTFTLFSGEHDARPATTKRDARWWLAFVLTAAIPAVTFYPFMKVAPVLFFAPFAATHTLPMALHAFSEQITNQLLVWALLNGLISLVLSFVLRGGKPAFTRHWIGSVVVSVISVGMAYWSLVFVSHVFQVDYRFWVLGLKTLDARHFHLFLIYLAPFTVFFLLSLRAFTASIPVKGESAITAWLFGALAMSLGFMVMLAAQYLNMHQTGLLLTANEPLNTIIAFQFVPILAVVGLIAAYTYRRSNDYVPGALICALFVTWYIVGGTAVFAPTMTPLGGGAKAPAVKTAEVAKPVAAPRSAKP